MQWVHHFLIAAACIVVAVDTKADMIIWQSSVNIFQGDPFDESHVALTGTLVDAVNGGAPPEIVNGVEFTEGFLPAIGDGQNYTSPAGFISVNHTNSADGPFGPHAVTGEYFGTPIGNLLDSGFFLVDSVTLNNLVVGDTYLVQVWNNEARPNRSIEHIGGYGDGSGTGPVGILEVNNSPPVIGAGDPLVLPETETGDYLIGTFTASSASLTFEAFGAFPNAPLNVGHPYSRVNAIQLRNITSEAIPEPSSFAAIAMGSLLILKRKRR